MGDKKETVKWLAEPEEHDYPAADSYLRLIINPLDVNGIINDLKETSIFKFKAKDIFRASKLSLLGVSNSHVEKNIKKINKGLPMSPILLVRDLQTRTLIIADGYHRMCAVYNHDEDALIPCKIVNYQTY